MYERGMAMRIGLREGAGTGACLGSGAVPPAARPRRLTGGAGRSRTVDPSDGRGASPALAGAISRLGFQLPPVASWWARRPDARVASRVLCALALILGACGALFGSHGAAHAQTLTVSVEDAIGNENTGVAFTITLNVSEMMPGTTTPAVRVRYRTSSDGGTAIQAPIYPGEKCSLKSDGTRDPEGASLSDYEFTSGTVVFTAGSSDGDTRTVTIPVCPGRTFPEDGYWFTFEFLEVTGAGFTEEGAMAIGTILPEPGSTAIALTLNPPSVAEGAGDTEVVVTATLDAGARPEATEVTVSVGDMGDSATSGTDYDAVNNFTVTISSGQTSGTGTFTLTPMDDNVAEGEETLTVSGSADGLTGDTAALTLTDDDPASTAIALTLNPTSVAEDAGGTEVTVTASLDAGARTEATEVTVSVGDMGDSATSGTDYDAVNNFTVTISSGQTSGTGTFTLTPMDDNVAEGEETLTVSGTSALPVTSEELTPHRRRPCVDRDRADAESPQRG